MFVHPPFLGLTCSYNMGEQKRNNKCSSLPPLTGTGLMPAQSLDNFGAAPSEGSCRRNWRKKADGTAGIFLSACVRFGQGCVRFLGALGEGCCEDHGCDSYPALDNAETWRKLTAAVIDRLDLARWSQPFHRGRQRHRANNRAL